MSPRFSGLLLAIAFTPALATTAEPAKPIPAEQLKFFEAKIRPVLIEHCYKCHSVDGEKLKGGLIVDTREGLLTGGDNGPAIIPGNLEKSLLIQAVRHKDPAMKMPPKQKLPDEVIADLEKWVKMGAPDPRVGKATPKKVQHEIDIESGKKFWAYQRPKPTPATVNTSWARSETDRLIAQGWATKNLKPVEDADPRTLVRRLQLDLVGVPPTPEVTERFLAEYAQDPQATLARLVDQLLESPHFGERWGRHWLDVARYAESTGKTVNFNYPHAWRYRDYVIAAFNKDKPYDLFIKEQIAGDLLAKKGEEPTSEQLIATGFLQIGSRNLNERNRLHYELDVVDEQIDAVTQGFLAQTAACARCHDHKFDAIPSRDYYALAGIFRSTENLYGTVRFVQAAQPSPLHNLPKDAASTVLNPLTSRERATIEKTIADLQDSMRKQTDPMRNIFTFASLEINRSRLNLYEKDGTPKVLAMGCRDRYRTIDSELFIRGEPEKKGEIVPRGVLQVVGGPSVKFDKKSSGRLQLAEWIASPENPLTARVYVNRVWLHLFGRGIVATPDNFGTTGTPPSNLALLDHLALQFTKDGWSTKKLIRSLVLSHVYQLSSKFDETSFTADPDNTLVWRMTPRRLDAEAVRDGILAVSGRLIDEPAKGSPVAQVGEGPTNRPALGSRVDINPNDAHRSVYLPVVRDSLPEVMSLFDVADPNMVIGERPSTTVPAQALFLMNNPFVIQNARAAAEIIQKQGKTDAERLTYAYKRFFNRLPTEQEIESASSFLARYSSTGNGNNRNRLDSWTALCQAFFASAEFLIRN